MKTLLVSAHPGHELRLHHWMEQVRPDVFIITDGSGSVGAPRLEASRRVLDRIGAHLLPGAGGLTDRRVYEAMRTSDQGFFGALRGQIAGLTRSAGYDQVVCDGLEGFNPVHDWSHYLVQALAHPLHLRVLEHSLVAAPDAWMGQDCWRLSLDAGALDRKLRAAAEYEELALEVEESLAKWGAEAFNVEVLRPVVTCDRPPAPPGRPPFYEVFGERRVREGTYPEVIRWESHVRPLVEGIWDCAV